MAALRPATRLGAALLVLAVGVSPPVIELFVSLEWRVGNLRKLALLACALLAGLGLGVFVARHRVNAVLLRLFPARRDLYGALALVAGSLLISLAAAELALWWLGLPLQPAWTPSETRLARFDPELGWSYLPKHAAVQEFGDPGRKVPMYFDEIGARVSGPDTYRDPQSPTVLLVGCSLTMGHGLPWEETFAGRLEKTPGFTMQVVNLGVQAYGTDQALLATRRHLRSFNVKFVVYTFIDDHIARNANSDRRLLFPSGNFIGTKPRFELTRDGTLALRERASRYADAWESRLWLQARIFWTHHGPRPDRDLTRALVRALRAEVEAAGARFLLLRWPGSRLSFDDPALHVVDLAARVPPEWQTWVIPGDGHPDARAGELVARVLAAELPRIAVLH